MTQLESELFGAVHALKCELASEVLRSSGRLRLRATGWSMLPTIWPGDILEIERVSSQCVAKGDIVLFGRDGRVFAHRIVFIDGVNSSCFITQGDGMASPDPAIAGSDLLGKVRCIIRADERTEPRPNLSFAERVAAFFVRRSMWAARLLVHFHDLRQTPQEQVAVCHS
jgi:hypothetical protein